MRSVTLQGTCLTVSRLGFGLSNLHHLLRSRDRQRLLSAALEAGINHFDAAPYYGHGLAERELGLFARRGRDKIVIASKFGITANPAMSRVPPLMYLTLAANAALRRMTRRSSFVIRRHLDYSSRNAVESLARSLKALRTDHLDVLFLHEPRLELLPDPGRLIETLQGLRSAGRVRHFGLSGSAAECLRIVRRYPALGELLQVDAAPGTDGLQALESESIPFHSTFGHFRGRSGSIPELLVHAVTANRRGVILFSTRHADRIESMARLIEAADRA
jgi:D-threo-aldose 1-dehydrogenase